MPTLFQTIVDEAKRKLKKEGQPPEPTIEQGQMAFTPETTVTQGSNTISQVYTPPEDFDITQPPPTGSTSPIPIEGQIPVQQLVPKGTGAFLPIYTPPQPKPRYIPQPEFKIWVGAPLPTFQSSGLTEEQYIKRYSGQYYAEQLAAYYQQNLFKETKILKYERPPTLLSKIISMGIISPKTIQTIQRKGVFLPKETPEGFKQHWAVPTGVKEVGASAYDPYYRYAYETLMGVDPSFTGSKQKLEQELMKSRYWWETYARFEDDKTFKDIKEEHPYLYLERDPASGIFSFETDFLRFQQEQTEQIGVGGVWNPAIVGKAFGAVILKVPFLRPSFWMSEDKGEWIARGEYSLQSKIWSGDVTGYIIEAVQSPLITDIALPLTGGAIAGKLVSGASKVGTGAIKVTGKGAKAVQWLIPRFAIGAGVSFLTTYAVGTGFDIGLTAAEQKTGDWVKDWTSPDVLDKLSSFGMQIGFGYLGYKSTSGLKPTQVKPSDKYGFKQASDPKSLYRKYALEIHPDRGGTAKAFMEMKSEYDLWRLRPGTGFEPSITKYKPPRPVSDIIFKGDLTKKIFPFKAGVEPIPKGWSLVPIGETGIVPFKPSYGFSFIDVKSGLYSTDVETFGYTRVDISKGVIDVPKTKIIDISKTPSELRKPFGYREVIGTPIDIPSITSYEGYPLTDKIITDWMEIYTPVKPEQSLTIKPVTQPVVYGSYRLLGFGKISLTPFVSETGMGIVARIEHVPLPKKLTSIFQQPSEPYIRAIDILTGRQIGHEFIDFGKPPVMKPEKVIDIPKEDYRLSDSQIHYEKDLITKKDFSIIQKDPFESYSKADVIKGWDRIAKKYLGSSKHLYDFETYKGYTPSFREITALELRKPMFLTKRNLFVLFGTKPIHVVFYGMKPVVEPVIKSFTGFKGKTFSVKDLTKKWDMGKSEYGKDVIKMGSGESQLLLKPPKTVEPLPITKKQIIKTDKKIIEWSKEKVPIKKLYDIGRFDIEQPMRFPTTGQKDINSFIPVFFGIGETQKKITGISSILKPKTDVFSVVETPFVFGEEIDETTKIGYIEDVIIDYVPDVASVTIHQPTVIGQQQEFFPVQDTFTEQTYVTQKRFWKPILPRGDGISEPSKQRQGFNVYVKTRQFYRGKPKGIEKFRLLTKHSYAQDDAKSLLLSAIDNSIAQTGYIKETDKPVKKLNIHLPNRWGEIYHKFIDKNGKYQELRNYAIDSEGEKNELDVYRWLQQQPRKVKTKSKAAGSKKAVSDFDTGLFDFDMNLEPVDKIINQRSSIGF